MLVIITNGAQIGWSWKKQTLSTHRKKPIPLIIVTWEMTNFVPITNWWFLRYTSSKWQENTVTTCYELCKLGYGSIATWWACLNIPRVKFLLSVYNTCCRRSRIASQFLELECFCWILQDGHMMALKGNLNYYISSCASICQRGTDPFVTGECERKCGRWLRHHRG